MIEKFKAFFNALLKETQMLSEERAIARHLARNLLYERQGPDTLYPDVKEKAERLKERMESLGKPIWVVETFRSAKKQDSYYTKGRSKGGKIITNAEGLESWHQYGLAFDVAFKKYNWNPPERDWWNVLGKEGEEAGLVWGGAFGDFGHFEWHPNFRWGELKKYFEIKK